MDLLYTWDCQCSNIGWQEARFGSMVKVGNFLREKKLKFDLKFMIFFFSELGLSQMRFKWSGPSVEAESPFHKPFIFKTI